VAAVPVCGFGLTRLQQTGHSADDSALYFASLCGNRLLRLCRWNVGLGGAVWAHNATYPTDQAGRQQLADELTAKGLKPTQTKQHFDRDKINQMVDAMKDGTFDWNKSSLQPVILGPNGEVMGGHHRMIAAHLAGIDLMAVPGPQPQVQRLPKNFRPVSDWIDVLPDGP
jgi:hypothetical protein